jgi:hypothetical protein
MGDIASPPKPMHSEATARLADLILAPAVSFGRRDAGFDRISRANVDAGPSVLRRSGSE